MRMEIIAKFAGSIIYNMSKFAHLMMGHKWLCALILLSPIFQNVPLHAQGPEYMPAFSVTENGTSEPVASD